MWTFGEEKSDTTVLTDQVVHLRNGYNPTLKINGIDHREIHFELLKVLARYKSMTIVDLSKRSKVSVQRILNEIPFLPERFFHVEGNNISLSDCTFNLTEKEIKRIFKTDV